MRRNPRVAVSIEQADSLAVDWTVTILGTATVHDDADRIDWASGWLYEKYETGETGDTEETDVDESGWQDAALVEIEIGSASWTGYE